MNKRFIATALVRLAKHIAIPWDQIDEMRLTEVRLMEQESKKLTKKRNALKAKQESLRKEIKERRKIINARKAELK